MKAIKYILLGLLFVAVFGGALVYLQLERVGLVAANALLRDRGFEITILEVEDYPRSHIRIPRIEVTQSNGSQYTLLDLVIPVRMLIDLRGGVGIGEIEIRTQPSTEPLSLMKLIEDLLLLPEQFDGIVLSVSRLVRPGLPLIENIEWRSAGSAQQVNLFSEEMAVEFLSSLLGDGEHRIEIQAKKESIEVLTGELTARRVATGYDLTGELRLSPELLLARPEMMSLALPVNMVGNVQSNVELQLSDAAVSTAIQLQLDQGFRLDYEISESQAFTAAVTRPISLQLDLAWPGIEWSITAPDASLNVSGGRFFNTSVDIENLDCSNVECSLGVSVDSGPVLASATTLVNVALESELSVGLGESVSLEANKARVVVTELNSDNVAIETVGAALADGMVMDVSARYQIASGMGELQLSNVSLEITQTSDTNRWPFSGEIVSGQVTADLTAQWSLEGGVKVSGGAAVRADDVAGFYDTLAFTGLSSEMDLAFSLQDEVLGYDVQDGQLGIELMDIGFPMNDLQLEFSGDEQQVAVSAFTVSALGGQIYTDPFSIALPDIKSAVNLRLREIQLPFIVALAKFDQTIETSGSISGMLPLTINDRKVTIGAGEIESDAPGIISYLGETVDNPTDPLDIAINALGNFHFDTLSSEVRYETAGDLTLAVRIEGTNPESDPLQPVIVNLELENNIPQMLRSMQGTRKVEDIVRQRAAQ